MCGAICKKPNTVCVFSLECLRRSSQNTYEVDRSRPGRVSSRRTAARHRDCDSSPCSSRTPHRPTAAHRARARLHVHVHGCMYTCLRRIRMRGVSVCAATRAETRERESRRDGRRPLTGTSGTHSPVCALSYLSLPRTRHGRASSHGSEVVVGVHMYAPIVWCRHRCRLSLPPSLPSNGLHGARLPHTSVPSLLPSPSVCWRGRALPGRSPPAATLALRPGYCLALRTATHTHTCTRTLSVSL